MPVITRADFSIAVYIVCKPLWVLEDFLFSALKLGVKEWQFGHRTSRFSGLLFLEFPSMWFISRGTLLVTGWTSPHPHLGHLWLHWSSKYLLTELEQPIVVVTSNSPSSHFRTTSFCSWSFWHWLLQYLFLREISLSQFGQGLGNKVLFAGMRVQDKPRIWFEQMTSILQVWRTTTVLTRQEKVPKHLYYR